MWRGQAIRYGSKLVKGVKVRVEGRLTLYEVRGNFQMVVERVADAGEGDKAAKLAALKKQLAMEGLFDAGRKRPLPAYPTNLGVVTSRSGAAIRDIIKVVRRRFPVTLTLAHAQVQGEEAPLAIVRALERLESQSNVDVVIVGRGGGSSEDLDAFNAETVVRTVAAYPVPIISAVGHEIDTTLLDLVADRRAATPSEAAELAVPDIRAIYERIAQETDTLTIAMGLCIERLKARHTATDRRLRLQDPRARLRRGVEILTRSREALARWPTIRLARARAELVDGHAPLLRWPKPAIQQAKTALSDCNTALRRWPEHAMAEKRHAFSLVTANLEAFSPLGSLARGYAVVRREADGGIVRDADDVSDGDPLDVTLHRGRLRCRVEKKIDARKR
jgi:exodeoxyribonuclease VII large subunit